MIIIYIQYIKTSNIIYSDITEKYMNYHHQKKSVGTVQSLE